MLELNKVHLGDNMQLIKQIPDNTVDSIVTDPPYGISFMNKKWDYDVPSVEFWKEAYRVLKPGGHILVACGTRTQHRMAVNIEDAGFEIRDIVAWIYGSGFPKSLDVSKAIDKSFGAEREITRQATEEYRADGNTPFDMRSSSSRERRDVPSTDAAKQWQGWGTALKPAMELWTLARKPIEGTVANNVLKWGCGGLNIDGCRVETDDEMTPRNNKVGRNGVFNASGGYVEPNLLGRFPANVIHDGSDEVVAMFPKTNASSSGGVSSGRNFGQDYNDNNVKTLPRTGHDDNGGSAARFFYTAKASQTERNEGLYGFEEKYTASAEFRPNHMEKAIDGEDGNPYGRWQPRKNIHPTVKPLDLMQYLCRLITPRGGLVLEPFAGSGTTCIACKLERMNFIGMEIDADYVKIAEARIKAADVQYDIFDFL